MTTNNNSIAVKYSDEKLRILVEEYITMQKHDFTFKSLCSYVLYRAMEEDKTLTNGLYDSNQLDPGDCERINIILKKIISEKRINTAMGDIREGAFADDSKFVKVIE